LHGKLDVTEYLRFKGSDKKYSRILIIRYLLTYNDEIRVTRIRM